MLSRLLEMVPDGRARRRLEAARADSGAECASPDLAALVRSVLLSAEVGGPVTLAAADVDAGWSRLLPRFGVSVLGLDGNRVQLAARPWMPGWTDELAAADPFGPAFQSEPRATATAAEGDPFLARVQHRTYRNPAQREAVRAALLAPPGATLLVHLPTGSGKSLCGHLLGLLDPAVGDDPRQLTVVIVPTDALNLDQEQRLDRFLGHRCAYRGADSAADRGAFLQRIRDGHQRLLFTSPEAFCRSLRRPLADTAAAGGVRALVVDEAHLVDAWGDAFRSEFQEIPGIRRQWLRCLPEWRPAFVTLLMSATLTPDGTALLRGLFPPHPVDNDNLFAVVRDPTVRPEPSYWFVECRDQEERDARLLETVRHAPRPLLIYTSLKKDRPAGEPPVGTARHYHDLLQKHGFRRLQAFDGDTPDEKRQDIVREWAADRLDIVTATSAFGLGVDKSDVRAVLHACIPESFDRYYQEVGRAGRDGLACTSLVLHTPDDKDVASALAGQRNISLEYGWPRWEKMFLHTVGGADGRATPLGDDRWRLDVARVPDYRDLKTLESDANLQWNVRTLLLMARAGLLEYDAERPPAPPETPDEAARRAWLDRQTEFRVIRLLDQHCGEKDLWEAKVEACRRAAAAAAARELDRMFAALQGHRCIVELLAETYDDSRGGFPDGDPRATALLFGGRCGGCPACRAAGRAGARAGSPQLFLRTVWPDRPEDSPLGAGLSETLDGRDRLFLTYPATDERAALWLIRWLVRNRVVQLAVEPLPGWSDRLRKRLWEDAELRGRMFTIQSLPERFGTDDFPPQPVFQPRPTAVVFAPGGRMLRNGWALLREWLNECRSHPVLIVIPDDADDPDRPDRRLAHVADTRKQAALQRRYGG